MIDGSTPTFRFSGLRSHLVFGVLAGAGQVIGGLAGLRAARRRGRGVGASTRAGANLAAGLLWAGAATSARGGGVRLEEDWVAIDLGWWWRGTIPYIVIAGVEEVEHPVWAGFGVRTDLRNWLALVLWGRRVPALVFDPPRRLPLVWFLPFTSIRVRQLRLGLDDREAFVAALRGRLQGADRTDEPAAVEGAGVR